MIACGMLRVFAQQPLDFTGQVLGIGDLRERNAVRPFTPAARDTR